MNYLRSNFTLLNYWKKAIVKNYFCYSAKIYPQRSFCSIKTPDGIEIRKLRREDIPRLIDSILPPERWNLSVNDINFILDIDPDGSVIALNETGNIVGTHVSCNLDKDTNIGLIYWVNDAYEQRGFRLTMRRIVADHRGTRNFIILGAPKTIEKYELMRGLQKGDIVQRFVGKIKSPANHEVNGVNIEKLSINSFDKIVKYDSDLCLNTRTPLLKKFIAQDHALTLLALKNSKLCGYGSIRDCIYAPKVQPLFADNIDIAKLLLLNLVEQFIPAKEKGIWIELAIKNEGGINMATAFGLMCVRTLPYIYVTENALPYHPKIYSRLLWQTLKH